jgi:hypothetical protein
MFRRKSSLVAALALLACGCVEGEQVFTLNPDGSGKVQVDLKMPALGAIDFGAPGGPQKKPQTVNEIRLASLDKVLSGSKGFVAWKDVSGTIEPDGRFRFKGTGYFEKLDKIQVEATMSLPAQLDTRGNGSLVLNFGDGNFKMDAGGPLNPTGDPLPGPDATDKELDEYILKQRVQYQAMRWMFRTMFSDMKLKNVYRLPGDVSGVTVFAAEGKRGVSFRMEGDEVIKKIDKAFLLEDKVFRKLVREKRKLDPFALLDMTGFEWHKARATVAKGAQPQFDFAQESKEARDGYPALRKQLGLGEEKKGFGGDPFEK